MNGLCFIVLFFDYFDFVDEEPGFKPFGAVPEGYAVDGDVVDADV